MRKNQITYPDADHLDLLFKKEQKMPELVEWSIYRYEKCNTDFKETGELNYSLATNTHTQKSLNLKFCISGNRYCPKNCQGCAIHEVETVDVLNFKFNPFYLKKMVITDTPHTKKEKILTFKYPKPFTQTLDITEMHKSILNTLLTDNLSNDEIDNIFINAKMTELLHYSMLNLQIEEREAEECPFLAKADSLNRIYDAKDILLKSLDNPVTIKELSRKVAMNECYLKKGFKEVFGMTIFDYYQNERMKHAKYLLYEKGLSVTDCADLLGYSSISHFSSAFKKFTGIKPCELLLQPH